MRIATLEKGMVERKSLFSCEEHGSSLFESLHTATNMDTLECRYDFHIALAIEESGKAYENA